MQFVLQILTLITAAMSFSGGLIIFVWWLRGQFDGLKDFVRDAIKDHDEKDQKSFERLFEETSHTNLRLMKMELQQKSKQAIE